MKGKNKKKRTSVCIKTRWASARAHETIVCTHFALMHIYKLCNWIKIFKPRSWFVGWLVLHILNTQKHTLAHMMWCEWVSSEILEQWTWIDDWFSRLRNILCGARGWRRNLMSSNRCLNVCVCLSLCDWLIKNDFILVLIFFFSAPVVFESKLYFRCAIFLEIVRLNWIKKKKIFYGTEDESKSGIIKFKSLFFGSLKEEKKVFV